MPTNRSAPTATVVPILIYPDVGEAIEWLCRAFGFSERLRAERNGVIGHAQLEVAEGAIMLGRQGGPFQPPQGEIVAQYVHITVPDVDRHFEHAKGCGAQVMQAPHDTSFGERQYMAKDHAGHWWTFSQHVADVPPEDWGAVTTR
jgi:uncharacterized glyoxalase superfamily protein PhnB